MHAFARTFLVLAALLGLAGVAHAADATVSFPTLGLAGGERPITGYLTRPKGDGPFPAVVLLHSCLGLPSDRRALPEKLAAWGYVALAVDDFAARGLRETCAVDFPEGLADAQGAVAFLARDPQVDPAHVAILGFSQGGDTALKLAADPPPGVAAVAAYYPPCGNRPDARLKIPTLILIGAADRVTPAAACSRLVRRQHPGVARLVAYPEAGHVFDDPAFAGGRRALGMWLQFDAAAAAQSRLVLRDFLAAHL